MVVIIIIIIYIAYALNPKKVLNLMRTRIHLIFFA